MASGIAGNPRPPHTPAPGARIIADIAVPPAPGHSPTRLRLRRLRTARGAAIPLAIALGLVLSIMLIGASALLATRNAASLERLSRSEDVRAALSDVLEALSGAETGQRGYLLTGRETYLAPYDAGTKALPGALDRLEAGLRDTSGAETRDEIETLRRLSKEKLDELAETIALARAGDRGGALAVVGSDRGLRTMDGLRATIDQLDTRHDALLAEQIASINRAGQALVLADALGLVLLAVLAGAIAWSAWQAFKTLRGAQRELTTAYRAVSESRERSRPASANGPPP